MGILKLEGRIVHTMPFWDEPFTAIKKEYPVIFSDQYHIDILNANFMLHPDWFNLVAESNLFVDILSDLAPAIAGKIGIAASANINPKREYPSMFEPVHCSAPDMGGRANTGECGDALVDVLKDLLK